MCVARGAVGRGIRRFTFRLSACPPVGAFAGPRISLSAGVRGSARECAWGDALARVPAPLARVGRAGGAAATEGRYRGEMPSAI